MIHPFLATRTFAIFISSLLLIAIGTGCEAERAKWKAAQAMNLWEAGDCQSATELLEEAHESQPNNREIKFRLAELLAMQRIDLAIDHCDSYICDHPDDLAAYFQRSICLQYLGRFEEALSDYKHSISDHIGRNHLELNRLAYFRGLANEELELAAEDIQTAINEIEDWSWGSTFRVPLRVRALVSCGLVSRFIGTQADLLPVMDDKIEEFGQIVNGQQVKLSRAVTDLIQLEYPLAESTEDSLKTVRVNWEVQRNCLLLLLATRALINEDLKQYADADRDRQMIEQLGSTMSEMGRKLPSRMINLEDTLITGATFLDTRGFVETRLPWNREDYGLAQLDKFAASNYDRVIADLDTAVLCATIHKQLVTSDAINTIDFGPSHVKRAKRMANRLIAVLLYHRMEANRKQGYDDLVAKDEACIRKLGLEPNDSLF